MGTTNGLLWISTPTFTVGLNVHRGLVVEAPPIARRWAKVGASVYNVASFARRRLRADVRWIPEKQGASDGPRT